MIPEYYNMVEEGYMGSGNNVVLILLGHNGAKNTICHCSRGKKYNYYATMTMYNLMNDQFDLNHGYTATRRDKPFYLLGGFIDLDKFKLVPIKNGEKLKPDTHYIVTTGNNIFKTVMTKEDGTMDCPDVKGYIPILPTKIVNEIFAKHNQVKRKLAIMQKDFE